MLQPRLGRTSWSSVSSAAELRDAWAQPEVALAEEDLRLLEVAAAYAQRGAPVSWSHVAAQLSGRTDSNAKRRHQSLMKGLPIGGSGCAVQLAVQVTSARRSVKGVCNYNLEPPPSHGS